MASKWPKISVIMSVFNGELYLRESIETILSQTFSDFEFIIIDDFSTDNSVDILDEYSNIDTRIKLYRNNVNLGLTKSLNKAIKLAQGEFIARQDADDVALSIRFEKQIEAFKRLADVVLVSCNVDVIDSSGSSFELHSRSCQPDLVPWFLLFHNHLAGHSQVMFKHSIVKHIGGYSETRLYSQDYELWSRMLNVGKIIILPEVLQKQRVHASSVSAIKRSEQRNLSLNQSLTNIKSLLCDDLSLEDVALLRRFWTGSYWWSSFPSYRKASFINSTNRELYRVFIYKLSLSNSVSNDISSSLSDLIACQFIYWMKPYRLLSMARLKLSFYAILWSPSVLVNFWLSEFYGFYRRSLHTLFCSFSTS